MMDLTTQCFAGCNWPMRSDTPLGGEGGLREMGVGGGSAVSPWVWGVRSGSPSSSCSQRSLRGSCGEEWGQSVCSSAQQRVTPALRWVASPEPHHCLPLHPNHIVFISSLLHLAASLWITSSFRYCSWRLRLVGLCGKRGCRALRPSHQAGLS